MKTTTNGAEQAKTNREPSRKALLAVLAQFNISPAVFDGLRSDTYEKHLYRRSLAELEAFYDTLLNTGEHYGTIQKRCPAWSGGKKDGELPSVRTLTVIKRRITAEETVSRLETNEHFLRVLQARTKGLPAERRAEIYEAILELLGEELITAKLDGKPLLENLKGVDRVMKAKEMAVRERQRDEQIKLEAAEQKIREKKLEMELTAAGYTRRSRGAKVEWKKIQPKKVRSRNGGMTEKQKTDALFERVWGVRPDDQETKDTEEEVEGRKEAVENK